MAKFLIEGSYNPEGAKGLMKDGGTGRKETVEKMVTGMGGKIEAFYFAFGQHDVYVICDMPDAVTASAIAIAVNASGLVTISTTVLLTPEEVDQAVKKSVNYRPPGK
ncbi:GYD domain-containing protein [Echinicola jeungdonensis]|uniref:GYD domain-containing protein n=1 Tax=Echinicola jeungdonensis TaxID=709343 RepID=A0ABV5J7I1_9BACT|nr:GYD domain-containing protein [Echinicola jeungdonensis]MDN3669765.1 GYD domain-containing protein [Echinicola jeungdonensis]